MEGGYFPLKSKRKGFEDADDDFSDFSLSSPATKMRRLDAELPPIIEEDEGEIPIVIEQSSLPQEQSLGSSSSGGIKTEELPSLPQNDGRAIVVFNPTNTATLVHSPSNFSVSVDPRFISGLKNQVLWSSQSNSWGISNDEAPEENNSSGSSKGCLAVVPWVPSQLPQAELPFQTDNLDMMDAQEVEETSMDVEDGTGVEQRNNANEGGGMSLSEGFNHWQQQHCMIPQPPHNTTTPIVWYR